MPYDPSTFAGKVALLRSGALAYAASIRTPGASAESLLPSVLAWVRAQSDSDRALDIVGVEVQFSGVLTGQVMRYTGANPAADVFGFRMNAVYSSGDVQTANVLVQVTRLELEGS